MKLHEKALVKYQQELLGWEARRRNEKEKRDAAAAATSDVVMSNTASGGAASSKAKAKGKASSKKSPEEPKPEQPRPPVPRMQRDEPRMFLHLATAMKLFMGRSIDENVMKKAQFHLEKYLLYFRQVSFSLSAFLSSRLT